MVRRKPHKPYIYRLIDRVITCKNLKNYPSNDYIICVENSPICHTNTEEPARVSTKNCHNLSFKLSTYHFKYLKF